MIKRLIGFFSVVLIFLLSACASIDYNPLPQSAIDELDVKLMIHLRDNPINFNASFIPAQSASVQKIPLRIAVIIQSSVALSKFPSADTFFLESFVELLERHFTTIKSMGIVQSKRELDKAVQQVKESGEVNSILIISNIVPNFEANPSNMYRTIKFRALLTDIDGNKLEDQVLTGYRGMPSNFELPTLRQHLISVIVASSEELVSFLFDKKASEMRRKAQLAEEERLRKILMEKLKAKRDQFLKYGFDVLEYVKYAKSNLRIKYDIDFGGAVPEIDFRTFKEKKYVEVKVNYPVTFNTLKVSMYESASMTFDEIVKKLAIRISQDFKKQDEIAGFIFNITYSNKNFLEKLDSPRIVQNEFILPKEACRQYANMDITNQDLINQSIVLVDGGRISLNLQISK